MRKPAKQRKNADQTTQPGSKRPPRQKAISQTAQGSSTSSSAAGKLLQRSTNATANSSGADNRTVDDIEQQYTLGRLPYGLNDAVDLEELRKRRAEFVRILEQLQLTINVRDKNTTKVLQTRDIMDMTKALFEEFLGEAALSRFNEYHQAMSVPGSA